MEYLVLCELCGLVCVCTAENYARKNATDHFEDQHNARNEVRIVAGTEIGLYQRQS